MSTPLARAKIRDLISWQFPQFGEMADASYMLPAEGWVAVEFSTAWRSFKKTMGKWTLDENDCDDFTRAAAFLAQWLHHNTPGKPAGTALAFGEFWYLRDSGGGHAINFFLYREAGQVKVGFFEPADGTLVTLSQKEIDSCVAWRL